MIQIVKKGKVILAGAGPGDPDLISLKALKYLQTADVILTDRLVSPNLIEEYARKDAEVIYVGKQCSKGIWTPQKDINDLMVEFALQDKLVLRLKGGDASLFSNVLDELHAVKNNNIPYEIISGISVVFGAVVYIVIRLTVSGFLRGFCFFTLYDLDKVGSHQWQDWATTEDTLVFYMSGQRLDFLTKQLLKQEISLEKGLAVVQQATTPNQKTSVFSFEDIQKKSLPEFEYVPTLLIIGKVVNLHHQFSWFTEKNTSESYFDNHKNIYQNAI
mgnify:FL=1